MRRHLVLTCALIAAASLPAFPQTNAGFLNLIVHSRFIMVTTDQGDPAEGRGTPDDQRAVVNLQNAIQQWKRFTLTWNTRDADIILAVRRGHIAAVMGGVVVTHPTDSRGRPTPPTVETQIGTDTASTGDDILTVYEASNFPNSTVLWRAQQKNGLAGKKMLLFERFKKDVDEADAKSNNKPKKP